MAHPIRSKLSLIHEVLTPRPDFKMCRVDAATVITAVTHHVIVARRNHR